MTFYRALAAVPGTRELADLELETDREKQIQELIQFRRDPWAFERHLTYSQRKHLEAAKGDKRGHPSV